MAGASTPSDFKFPPGWSTTAATAPLKCVYIERQHRANNRRPFGVSHRLPSLPCTSLQGCQRPRTSQIFQTLAGANPGARPFVRCFHAMAGACP